MNEVPQARVCVPGNYCCREHGEAYFAMMRDFLTVLAIGSRSVKKGGLRTTLL